MTYEVVNEIHVAKPVGFVVILECALMRLNEFDWFLCRDQDVNMVGVKGDRVCEEVNFRSE